MKCWRIGLFDDAPYCFQLVPFGRSAMSGRRISPPKECYGPALKRAPLNCPKLHPRPQAPETCHREIVEYNVKTKRNLPEWPLALLMYTLKFSKELYEQRIA